MVIINIGLTLKLFFSILALLFLLLSFESSGQVKTAEAAGEANMEIVNEHLSLFLGTVTETKKRKEMSLPDFQAYIEKLRLKRSRTKGDKTFFNYLFYRTHRKYLKNYQIHSSVEDILRHGAYDCLSGTAFYAMILDKLGIAYEIKEFDFHVLVIAKHGGRQFLIESTDPGGGLTSNPKEIADRIGRYVALSDSASGRMSVGSNDRQSQYSRAINKSINLTELAGLLHFNNAVYYYNQKKPFKTVAEIRKSLELYDSERIRAFGELAARSFLGDPGLSLLQKQRLMEQLKLVM